MSEWIFDTRKKALEELFILQRENQLLEKLRQEGKKQDQKERLRDISGITDDAVLEQAVRIGLSEETFAAISLIPLLEVAWADGLVDLREKEAILLAAEANAIKKDSTAYKLLQSWLDRSYNPQLISLWQDFILVLSQKMSSEELLSLRNEVVKRAYQIALSSGGLPVLGTLSQDEKRVIEELELAFRLTPSF